MSFVDAGPIKFGERVGPRRCGSDERSPMKHQRLVRGAVGGVLHRHQHRGQVRARVVVAVLRRTIPRPAGFGIGGKLGQRGAHGRCLVRPTRANLGCRGSGARRCGRRCRRRLVGTWSDPMHTGVRNDRGSHTGQDHERHQPGGGPRPAWGGRSGIDVIGRLVCRRRPVGVNLVRHLTR